MRVSLPSEYAALTVSGQGDDKAERALERALARGPLDVLDLVGAVRTAAPRLVELREGAVHALLHRLVRAQRILPGGRSARGLVLYRMADTPEPAAPHAAEASSVAESVAHVAARIASAVKDPAARGRIHADVAAHRQALAEDGKLDSFGSPRATRYLLHRVERGRATVCTTDGAGDTARRFLLHEGPWIAGAVVLFFVLKFFVMPIYVIPSKSMVPNLLVNDRVAVFLPGVGGVPERWRIVTYEKGELTYVKRLIGLPGEEIAILHGDIFIDGKLLVKPDSVREALRSRVGRWDFRKGTPQGWGEPTEAHDERAWAWRSGGFPAHPPGALGNSFVLRDGYVRLTGDRGARGEFALTIHRGPAGSVDAASVAWTLEVGVRGIRLREERTKDGAAQGPPNVLASRDAPPAAGPVALELSYVDGVLRASCADWVWQGARAAPDAALGVRIAERGVRGGIHTVGVDRDIHYAHLGTQGVPQPGQRGPNPHRISKTGVFCMGDNTTDSKDSRYRDPGDIPVDKLIGPVSLRVWPPGRWGFVK